MAKRLIPLTPRLGFIKFQFPDVMDLSTIDPDGLKAVSKPGCDNAVGIFVKWVIRTVFAV